MKVNLFFSVLIVILSAACETNAQPGIISTIAGTGAAAFSGDGGLAVAAAIDHPIAIAVDDAGNTYFADVDNNRIRKINSSGVITTIAGTGVAGFSGDGGPAVSAQLNSPYGVALDAHGNIYIADFSNQRIRKISPLGIITTVAGTGVGGYSGDGGPAISAQVWNPANVRVDVNSNLFIADNQNHAIRKIDYVTGVITTVAGTGVAGFSGDGGPAVSARLNFPGSMWIDDSGYLFICDSYNSRIRKVSRSGVISTIAGNGAFGYSGDGGPAITAKLNNPNEVIGDNQGNIYISDNANNRVRKVNSAGVISTIAGTGVAAFSGDGGPATLAEVNGLGGLFFDRGGNLLLSDVLNNRIRKIGHVGHAPSFQNGPVELLSVCNGESAASIDTQLSITDSDAGLPLAWSTVAGPFHGTVVDTFSAVSSGGVVIPTGLTYRPGIGYTGPDTVEVQVTDGLVADTIVIVFSVSICDLSATSFTGTEVFEFYPNPTSGRITIAGLPAAAGQVPVEIFDCTGRIVAEYKVTTGSQELAVDAPPGVYYLRATTQSGTWVRKFVLIR